MMSKFTVESAKKLLWEADVFYEDRDTMTQVRAIIGHDIDAGRKAEIEEDMQTLNMNDVFGWAKGFGQYVPDKELPEVARLFWAYGFNGLVYWVSKQNNNMRSEFEDVNRAIDFVRHEEDIVKQIPDSSKRAYKKIVYFLGANKND